MNTCNKIRVNSGINCKSDPPTGRKVFKPLRNKLCLCVKLYWPQSKSGIIVFYFYVDLFVDLDRSSLSNHEPLDSRSLGFRFFRWSTPVYITAVKWNITTINHNVITINQQITSMFHQITSNGPPF